MPTAKPELRKQLKKARLELPATEHAANSATIVKRLKLAIDWSKMTTLSCFEPIAQLNEVDISGFISALRIEQPSLKVYAPKQVNGIWQIPDLKFDVIIVPMLGFDPKTLHRIGYGGGYYDKFLATQPQAQKIGVCFDQAKTNNLPTDPNDIALDTIVTDQTIYSKHLPGSPD